MASYGIALSSEDTTSLASLADVDTYESSGTLPGDPDYHSALDFILDEDDLILCEDSTSNTLGDASDAALVESQYSQVTSQTDSDFLQHPLQYKRSPLQRVLGLCLVLGASFLFSASATAAKYLYAISPGQFVIIRGSCGVLLLLPASLYNGTSLITFPKKPLVALRCIAHGFGYTLKIWCVKNMSIGDAISIYFTAIIFAGLFSRIFLKEKYTLANAMSVIFGFAGVFLIAKPSFVFKNNQDSYNPLYCLIALTAACCTGVGYTTQRAIGPKVGSSITPFYTNLSVIVGGAVVNLVAGDSYTRPDCFDERVILLACGIGACAALVMLNIGLSIEKSASATIMRNMDIVLAFAVQVFLFKEGADWLCMLGAGLIITSAVSVTLENAFCPNFFWQI